MHSGRIRPASSYRRSTAGRPAKGMGHTPHEDCLVDGHKHHKVSDDEYPASYDQDQWRKHENCQGTQTVPQV